MPAQAHLYKNAEGRATVTEIHNIIIGANMNTDIENGNTSWQNSTMEVGLPQGLVSCKRSRSERSCSGSKVRRRSSPPQRQTWCFAVSCCRSCRQSVQDATLSPWHSQTDLCEQHQSSTRTHTKRKSKG